MDAGGCIEGFAAGNGEWERPTWLLLPTSITNSFSSHAKNYLIEVTDSDAVCQRDQQKTTSLISFENQHLLR